MGFEPTTSGTTNRRSNQLSYDRHTSPANGDQSRIDDSAWLHPLRERAFCTGLGFLQNKNWGWARCTRFSRGGGQAMGRRMDASGESSNTRLLSRAGVLRFPSPRLDLFVMRDFLSRERCERLVALIEDSHRPSTIADYNGDDAFRTSSTCDLSPAVPEVADLAAALHRLSGIDPAHAEPLQGQRYEPGQEFKAHTDYFEPGNPDYQTYCAVSGQRTWTFMVYLNDVEAGGATRFKVIDKLIQPEAGKLVGWNNRRADGSPNPATLHHAMKVRKGRKYVITQWYRERAWG